MAPRDASRLHLSSLHSVTVAKYRKIGGFWLSIAAALWALMALGTGLRAVANNPTKYANDVMIPTLVLLSGIAVLFIWLAVRVRQKGRNGAKPS